MSPTSLKRAGRKLRLLLAHATGAGRKLRLLLAHATWLVANSVCCSPMQPGWSQTPFAARPCNLGVL